MRLGHVAAAVTKTAIIGSQIHGSTNNASPARVTRGFRGRNRSPAARAPWNAKEAQPCSAFHASTGANISRATASASQGLGVASQCRCLRLDSR